MELIAIFCVVMTAVFVALKFANVITWSWLWVLTPIWSPIALIALSVAIKIVQEFLDSILND